MKRYIFNGMEAHYCPCNVSSLIVRGDDFIFARRITQGWANPGVILVHRFPTWTRIYSGLSAALLFQGHPHFGRT